MIITRVFSKNRKKGGTEKLTGGRNTEKEERKQEVESKKGKRIDKEMEGNY